MRVARILRSVPVSAWVCALVAVANAISWSFITPPFQAPDEPAHFAYVKQVAETGKRPTLAFQGGVSEEEAVTLTALHHSAVRLDATNEAIISPTEQAALERLLHRHYPADGSAFAGVATSEPPLYYALEAIPYLLGSGGTLLERLQLVRLFSALFAGLTALFAFLFVRETLPGVRWAWTVGALFVALSPLFGFMSGAVNPDSMLFAVSAALLYCFARAFARGMTTKLGIATGAVIATGLLTKLSFTGLVPGAFIGLGVLGVRSLRNPGRGRLRGTAIAAAIAVLPGIAYLIANGLAGHSLLGIYGSVAHSPSHGSVLEEVNYTWQLYLPRLPATRSFFPELFTTRQIWFDGYVGRLGWLDTYFPEWVYTFALVIAVSILGLCARALLASRAVLGARVAEIAVYASMLLGLMLIVALSGYQHAPRFAGYGQARYLLPVLPLLGAIVALAARGAGRRWGPVVGVAIVALGLSHEIFSQLQVIARYYG
jgi:4-amino-4-deoxy-L-arabinose transferase-like glycosyltransferase